MALLRFVLPEVDYKNAIPYFSKNLSTSNNESMTLSELVINDRKKYI